MSEPDYSTAGILEDLRAYTCPVIDCEAALRSGKLMCARHWRLVDNETRADVYAAVRRLERAAKAHGRVAKDPEVINHVDPTPAERKASEEWLDAEEALREVQLRAVVLADERG